MTSEPCSKTPLRHVASSVMTPSYPSAEDLRRAADLQEEVEKLSEKIRAERDKYENAVKVHEDRRHEIERELSRLLGRPTQSSAARSDPSASKRQRQYDGPVASEQEVLRVLKRIQPARASRIAHELGIPTLGAVPAVNRLRSSGQVEVVGDPSKAGRYPKVKLPG